MRRAAKEEGEEEERLRREAETERSIREVDQEPTPWETATTGSSGQRQQKKGKKQEEEATEARSLVNERSETEGQYYKAMTDDSQ